MSSTTKQVVICFIQCDISGCQARYQLATIESLQCARAALKVKGWSSITWTGDGDDAGSRDFCPECTKKRQGNPKTIEWEGRTGISEEAARRIAKLEKELANVTEQLRQRTESVIAMDKEICDQGAGIHRLKNSIREIIAAANSMEVLI